MLTMLQSKFTYLAFDKKHNIELLLISYSSLDAMANYFHQLPCFITKLYNVL